MSNLRASLVVLFTVASGAAFAQRTTTTATPPEELRPQETTVGIGAGWTFPQSILEPNTVSVRIKFGPALALEPYANLGGRTGGTATVDSVTLGGTTTTAEDEDTNGGLNLGAGANVRYAFASAGPVDFVGLGGIAVNYGSNTVNRDVLEENVSDVTNTSGINVNANWGVGVEWFINRNVVLSADATNPLVSWSRSTTRAETEDNTGAEPFSTLDESTTTNLDFGLRLMPSVRVMFHLYF